MPLRDHFHPPLSVHRHWHAFHPAWATVISFALNEQLPDGYFAEPNVKFGIEIDVAAFESSGAGPSIPSPGSTGAAWSPPAPVQSIPLPLITDVIEVAIYSTEEGP